MKTKFTIALSAFVFVSVFGFSAFAQSDNNTDNHQITITIPSVALLDIEATGTKNFDAEFTQVNEAGDKLTDPTANTGLWLNYSSIQTGSQLKKVTVSATQLVTGVDVSVLAGTGTGVGTLGTASSAVTITGTAQTLISGIGSAYTVSGINHGHQLTYNFTTVTNNTNYGALRSGTSTPITVTYTLSDI